jgi:hypothetical protein
MAHRIYAALISAERLVRTRRHDEHWARGAGLANLAFEPPASPRSAIQTDFVVLQPIARGYREPLSRPMRGDVRARTVGHQLGESSSDAVRRDAGE